ncbi:MAG TPA: transglycosylase domain-containing protein, partial [Pseudonocardiaceae bacterium]|nr:transglycosylase domain-containing protein [Pseudonocardiaceae bacterium]
IMASYLNIVYFGRSAYGIGAAAKTYFNKTPDQLTNPEAALLAGLIQSPGRANSVSFQTTRFKYVIGQMAKNHWLNPGEETAALPLVQPLNSDSSNLQWDRKLIEQQVLNELRTNGLAQEDLQRVGAKVYTTIQPAAQTSAETSVQQVMAKEAPFTNGQPVTFNGKPVLANGKPVPGTQAAALVSIDPTTGGIIAWYGGNDPKANQLDMADTPHQPGSSFKPYVFASALQNDPSQEGLNSLFDGSNTVQFGNPPNQVTVHNSEGEGKNPSTVMNAMTNSLNTVFYAMGIKTGLPNVQKTAQQAGIPKTIKNTSTGPKTVPSLQDQNGVIEGGISIGQYPVRPRDQAQGYATLANYGTYIPSHFVTKVVDDQNGIRYAFNTPSQPAFGDEATSNSIARTVIESMSQVASSDKLTLTLNRPVASKTGTQDYKDPNSHDSNPGYDSDAWMCGFTPSVVTAVWIGHYDRTAPIFGVGNDTEKPGGHTPYIMFGHQDPGLIWKNYMDGVLGNQPVQQFNDYPLINGMWNFVTNSPISQTPTSQSSQPNLPSGGGGGGGGTTSNTTTETTTETTTQS